MYSIADQAARFANAKKTHNARYIDIATVFEGSYLADKNVLITGGNRGLGLAIVKELVSLGAHVCVVVRRTCTELEALGCQVITNVDVRSYADVCRVIPEIRSPLDYVINNAGYYWEEEETLQNMNFDEQMRQIDVCAIGPLRMCHALLQANLVKCIVIITSQAGSLSWRPVQNPHGHNFGHHMSRAACNMGALLLAQELKPRKIPVLLLHPGFNRTDMTARFSHVWDEEGAVDASVGAKRVLHEMRDATMKRTGTFVNCEDGLQVPF